MVTLALVTAFQQHCSFLYATTAMVAGFLKSRRCCSCSLQGNVGCWRGLPGYIAAWGYIDCMYVRSLFSQYGEPTVVMVSFVVETDQSGCCQRLGPVGVFLFFEVEHVSLSFPLHSVFLEGYVYRTFGMTQSAVATYPHPCV